MSMASSMELEIGQLSSDPLNEPATINMNPTPLRESRVQRDRTQEMKSVAPGLFNELLISHISRRLDLNDGKLDELMNGGSKRKFSVSAIKMSHLRRITSPFHQRKTKADSDKESTREWGEMSPKMVKAISRLMASVSSPHQLQDEGLFRKSGNIPRMRELKHKVMENSNMDLTPYSTHDRATTIKNLLSDLPEPLLLERHIESFHQAIELNSTDSETACQRCLRVMQLLMLHLPQNNALILQQLLSLLHAVSEEPSNKMDNNSLGTVFAPHLLLSKRIVPDSAMSSCALKPAVQVIAFMIENNAKLFLVPPELIRDVDQYFETEERLSGQWSEQSTPRRRSRDVELTPVSTSLTFSARSTECVNMTDSELAKLHAHVQSLPESERRKLSKQLTDVTVLNAAPSTPSSLLETPRRHHDAPRRHNRSKSLSSSIKKHFPVFKSKIKHSLDSGGEHGHTMFTEVVNIEFEDLPPNDEMVSDCKLKVCTSTKRKAADSHMCTPVLNSKDHPRRFSEGVISPPKVACREPEKANFPLHSPPTKGGKRILINLQITENEKGYIPAPDQQEEKLEKILTPALQHNSSALPNLVSCHGQESHQHCQSRSREHRRHPQSAMKDLLNRETAL